MQAQARAYEGYWENGSFFTAGRTIRLPENRRMIVTIFDEPAIKARTDEIERRKAWLKKLDEAIKDSADEELVYIPRSQEMRPPHGLTDND